MEWLKEPEVDSDEMEISPYWGICFIRFCSSKVNCFDYNCVVLIGG